MRDESSRRDMANSITKMVDGKFVGVKYYHSPQGYEVLELSIQTLEQIGQLKAVKETLIEFDWRQITENAKILVWTIKGWWKNPYN